MMKRALTATALAAVLAAPAFAQQSTPMSPPSSSAAAVDNVRTSTGAEQAGFLQQPEPGRVARLQADRRQRLRSG